MRRLAESFSVQAFFEPDGDRSARIIFLEAPLSRDQKSLISRIDLSVLCSRYGRLELRCFPPSGGVNLESKLAIVKWVVGPNALTERRMVVLKTKIGIIPFRTQGTPLQLVGFRLF